MTKRLFLDSSGWVALLNSHDSLHHQATASWNSLLSQGYRIFLTSWIIAEVGNSVARSHYRQQFTAALKRLQIDNRVTLRFIDSTLLAEATSLFESRSDKTWGLVDCASFAWMRAESIREAFTADRHFEQAGFVRLLL
jgi:predicted nucleic acid-binding protein